MFLPVRHPFRLAFALAAMTLVLISCRGEQAGQPRPSAHPGADAQGLSPADPTAAAVPADRYLDPDDLVSIDRIDPKIVQEPRYAGTENFLGRVVDGYQPGMSIRMVRPAAIALSSAARDLAAQGVGLKVYDAYRPQIAVDHFVRWSLEPADTLRKADYYPGLAKPDLFELGYIARTSSHTTGTTVDLTLIDLTRNGEELDMGSPFDFFGEISHHGAAGLTPQQLENRRILRLAMEQNGFAAYEKEWWHYRWVAPAHGESSLSGDNKPE